MLFRSCLPFTVDQFPIGLAVSGVEHHTVVHHEVRRLGGPLSAFQILSGCHYKSHALSDAGSDGARIFQFAKPNDEVHVFSNEIEKTIRDSDLNPNFRVNFQEPLEKLQKRLLPQNDGDRNPQQTFGPLLSQRENSLSILQ